jgi:hypothetical protein
LIDREAWIDTEGGIDLVDGTTSSDRLAVQFSTIQSSGTVKSKQYFVSAWSLEDSGNDGRYSLLLREIIDPEDSWVESSSGVLNADDTFGISIYKLEEKDATEFEGRFFMKVISNAVTQTYLVPSVSDTDVYRVTGKMDTFTLADKVGDQFWASNGSVTEGIYNTEQITWTQTNATVLTDTESEWDTATTFNNGTGSTSEFFIDYSGFVAAQEDTTDPYFDADKSGRMWKGNPVSSKHQYVNGLEGIVSPDQTSGFSKYEINNTSTPQQGPRHWSSTVINLLNPPPGGSSGWGNGYVSGTANWDNTYLPSANGGHYMHLSYSCIGEDLHDGEWGTYTSPFNIADLEMKVQKIKYDSIYKALGTAGTNTSAASGYTYNTSYNSDASWNALSTEEKEVNYNQFNPSHWDPYAKSVIDNLVVGNRFHIDGDPEIYTILRVNKKFLYNHTAWNPAPYHDEVSGSDLVMDITWDPGNPSQAVRSVSEAVTRYFATGNSNHLNAMLDTIENFGKANNRRVCYILELDKDPTQSASYATTLGTSDNNTSTQIRFIDNYMEDGSNTLPTSPAIFETEAKEDQDLNIYYEASDCLPLRVEDDAGDTRGHLLAPIGSKILCSLNGSDPTDWDTVNEAASQEVFLRVTGWSGNTLSISLPGLVYDSAGGSGLEATDYIGKWLRFVREDGSYTQAVIKNITIPSNNKILELEIKENTSGIYSGLPYYNCFSFGNGVESNRIRDDFNESFILNGVKASTVLEEPYEEERRKYGLIYSGLYNSISGINNLNQFIQAEKITKDLMPIYGSIQRLYARDKDLITLCEDKVLQIFVDRDVLFNADGNAQLLSTDRVLGEANPFRGNYGISKNPESFAVESFRAYFTDKQRGAVLRLSMDGLTPISDAGMHDFFRDNLRDGGRLYGSYDSHKGDYNLTINFADRENKVCNPGFEEGLTTDVQLGSNFVLNNSFSNITTTLSSQQITNGSFAQGLTGWFRNYTSSGTDTTSLKISANNSPLLFLSANIDGTVSNAGYSNPNASDGSGSVMFDADSTNGVLSDYDGWIHTFTSSSAYNVGTNVDVEWEVFDADSGLGGFTPFGSSVGMKIEVQDKDGNGFIISKSDIKLGQLGGLLQKRYHKFTKTIQQSVFSQLALGTNVWMVRIFVVGTEANWDGKKFNIDNVSLKSQNITTDDWTLNSNVVNNGFGDLVFSDGGEAVQTGTNLIEAGKTYRITQTPWNPSGHPLFSLNGMSIISSPQDITFSASSNDITLSVINGGLSLPSITIQEAVPFGGNVDCWDLNGAGSDFLYTSQSSSGGSIIFDEAPEDTYLYQNLIYTNGVLDFTNGTKCNVMFDVTNYTGSGELTFVLYNDDGDGFEYAVSGNGSYSFSDVIGSVTGGTPIGKFGFIVSSTSDFSGEIDNVSLIIDGEGAGKTISYNERSKGWTSFKSFIPEFGISSVNQYYTMNLGQLWKHHTNQTRNTFYNNFTESSITPILNMQPEIVKHFNTLNYEGSQSKVDQFLTYEVEVEGGFPIGNNLIIPTGALTAQSFIQAPNSSVSWTVATNNISVVDLHGEGGVSDWIQIMMPNLDTNKTYRLSFDFSATGLSGQSHVYFAATSIPPVISTSLNNSVFSEDFTPSFTTEYLFIIHPHGFNGFTQDVNIELTNVLLQELDFTTDENDGEYYNLQTKKGWYVSNIYTDKQEGTLNEFIEKEGKWFNYIKGTSGKIDTAAFNFQGLGIVQTID